MFNKILIANRGEIAVRIARTCKRLGIGVVAVYSDADRTALHVRRADEAYWIGPSEARLSYLNGAAIIAAAKQSGAEAVHPGYGFLSENAGFAQQVIDAGLVWIGPPPAAMRAMGDKAVAKRLVAAAGVPVVPGYDGEDQSDARLRAEAEQIGYPLLIKATAGGGGRGMREVHEPVAFQEALESARREALSAFGDDRVLLERLITQARHVEVQVLGDEHGHLVHLGERDCSVQRRHQKVIEEAPSPAVDEALRARMGQAAVEAARRAGYTNAGTVEFLLAPDESFYFLEMNTRLQVEHPVTEMITGFDLVELQLRAAAGEPLPLAQDDVKLSGHAIEARLYAEDPYHDYLPASGKLNAFSFPAVEGTRVDRGYEQSDEVSSYYDSLLAKLVGFNGSRDGALRNLEMLVGTSKVAGVATNLPLLRAVLRSVEFIMGRVTTDALPKIWQPNLLVDAPTHDALLAVAATIVSGTLSDRDELPRSPWESAGPWRTTGVSRELHVEMDGEIRSVRVTPLSDPDAWLAEADGERCELEILRRDEKHLVVFVGNHPLDVHVLLQADPIGLFVIVNQRRYQFSLAAPKTPDAVVAAGGSGGQGQLVAPMPGTIVKVNVAEGERVRAHQTLAVLEAMKMEHAIEAAADGRVKTVYCRPGQRVAGGELLIEVESGREAR